jgi:hypothetical protein
MDYLKANLGSVFPFPTGSCKRVVWRKPCDLLPFKIANSSGPWWAAVAGLALLLQPPDVGLTVAAALIVTKPDIGPLPGWIPGVTDDPVVVEEDGPKSFTFKTTGGPLGAGDTILFRTDERHGWVYLDEYADAPHAWPGVDEVAPTLAQPVWQQLGRTLHRHYYSHSSCQWFNFFGAGC